MTIEDNNDVTLSELQDTDLIVDIDDFGCITIEHIGESGSLSLDISEWKAFKQLIAETEFEFSQETNEPD